MTRQRKMWRRFGPLVLIRHEDNGHRQAGVGFSRTLVWLNLWKFSAQLRFRSMA